MQRGRFRHPRTGLVVNPRYPATINLYFPHLGMIYTPACSPRLGGSIRRAERSAPSGLVTGAVSLGYRNPPAARPLVQYEALAATGLGGTSQHDGTPIVHPDEPLHRRLAGRGGGERISGAGAPLRHPGPTRPAPAAPVAASVTCASCRCRRIACSPCARPVPPSLVRVGLAGGEGPAVSRTTVNPGTAGPERLAPRSTRASSRPATCCASSAAAAQAAALRRAERDGDAVRRRRGDGYVSREAAMQIYGLKGPSGRIRPSGIAPLSLRPITWAPSLG